MFVHDKKIICNAFTTFELKVQTVMAEDTHGVNLTSEIFLLLFERFGIGSP